MQVASSGNQNVNAQSTQTPSSSTQPSTASAAPASANEAGAAPRGAVELDSLRLRLVDELAKLLAQMDGLDEGLSAELLKLRDTLWQGSSAGNENARSTETLLQMVAKLGTLLSDPARNAEALSLLREITALSLPSGATGASAELLARLARNDFAGIDGLMNDLRSTLEESTGLANDRSLQTLLPTIRELGTLGTPATIQPTTLAALENSVIQKTAIPLDAATSQALQKQYTSSTFTATLTQVTPQAIQLDQQTRVALPPDSPWSENLRSGDTLQFSLEKNGNQTLLQPWPSSAHLPAAEQEYWRASGLPPTANTVAVRDFLTQYGPLPSDPALAGRFGESLHQLSLLMPQGQQPDAPQRDLLLRAVLLAQGEPLSESTLRSLVNYQANADPEGDLLRKLPESVRAQVLRELPEGTKALVPETLQAAVEKTLDELRQHNKSSEVQQLLQQLKEQLQWTRLDQDTRHPADREQVFYWMQGNDLQKGRLRVRDERENPTKSGARGKERTFTFSVETRMARLGKVQADLKLSGERLDVRIADEKGTALEAVQAERETLVEELAAMGLELGDLAYGSLRLRDEAKSRPRLGNADASSRLDVVG